MAEVTRDDVDLVLKLYDMRREPTMREARRFMIEEFYAENGKEFAEKSPPGSKENAYFRQATSYWDMVGTFVTCGWLNKELLSESSGALHIFREKARAATQDMRHARNK